MTTQSSSSLEIRPSQPGDLPHLLRLNNAAVPAVNELTAEALLDLLNSALTCVVAAQEGEPRGFLLCVADGTGYESRNYQWLSKRFSNFAYTDRICVDATLRGQKIGDALYAALFKHLEGSDRCFVCEVNERPPNPGSLRFHKRLGFDEVGRADNGDKAVVYLKREPEQAAKA